MQISQITILACTQFTGGSAPFARTAPDPQTVRTAPNKKETVRPAGQRAENSVAAAAVAAAAAPHRGAAHLAPIIMISKESGRSSGGTSLCDAALAASSRLNEGNTYPETVPASAAGQPLLDFLVDRYAHSTREAWTSHCRAGRLRLNGTPATADCLLREGQRLEYHRPPWREPAAPRWLWTLFADEHAVVLCKPSGLPTLPSELYHDSTVLSLLRRGGETG